MKWVILALVFAALIFALIYFYMSDTATDMSSFDTGAIRYVALGDSYTSGYDDVKRSEAWPSLIVDMMQSEGVKIELIENLAVSGYTAQDVLAYQLPEYRNLNPQLATILVGTNDIALGVDEASFREQFSEILDEALTALDDKRRLVVLTIPDFTMTPRGMTDFSDDFFKNKIESFNGIIKDEATKRSLQIVDLQNINEGIESNNSFFTSDGLHPSAKHYKLWAERISPKVKEVL